MRENISAPPLLKGNEKLKELHINLPNHWAIDSETLWGAHIEGDHYELKNAPCYAYGLNMGDVVEARVDPPALKLEIKKVIKRSGHDTLRALFKEHVPMKERIDLVKAMEAYSAVSNQVTANFFCFDIPPEGDFDAIYKQFESMEGEGYLEFETCEEREEGSFDDLPKGG